MNLVKLNSVGNVIDLDKLYIYPQLENGEPDYTEFIELEWGISIGWYESLSEKDWNVVESVLKKNGMRMGDFDACDDYNFGYGA